MEPRGQGRLGKAIQEREPREPFLGMFGTQSKLTLGSQAERIADLDVLLNGYEPEDISATWTVSADDLPAAPYTGTLQDAKACAMRHRTPGGWAKVELGGRPIWAL